MEISKFLAFLILLPCTANGKELVINSAVVDSELLEDNSVSPIFIKLANGNEEIIQSFNNQLQPQSPEENDARAFAFREALLAHTTATQAAIRSFLNLMGVDFLPYWVVNWIYIKNSPASLILALLEIFGNEILEIRKEEVLPLLRTFDVAPAENIQGTLQPGVQMMEAPAMWGQGCTGQGIYVALLDTGCNGNHQDLKGKLAGQDDKVAGTGVAQDLHGHGTHCAGTICGSGGTGMAPDARLYACKCCEAAGCPQSSLASCAEYACCPNPDPSCNCCKNNPRVASCSWGGGSGNTWFVPHANAWNSIGIFPSFAGGNSGPSCSTLGSPGDYPQVCSVGAIDPTKSCTNFSSRGPSVLTSDTKPNVVAPGSKIVSCSNINDSGYATMSGTSMACPHISGAAALLLSCNPNLSNNDILRILVGSCDKSLSSTGATCGGRADTVFPNYVYGEGKPSCNKAMSVLKAMQNLGGTSDQ